MLAPRRFFSLFLLSGALLAYVPSAWAGEPEATVSFVGASETAGFGLSVGEFAYPAVLARRCGFIAQVDGEVNKPVLFRELAASRTALVLFVSQFDAFLQPSRADIMTWLKQARAAKTIIVEAPLIPAAGPNSLAEYQRRFYGALDDVASEAGVTVVLLRYPPKVNEFTQADGLHPNERGQLYIADTLQPVLNAARLCVK